MPLILEESATAAAPWCHPGSGESLQPAWSRLAHGHFSVWPLLKCINSVLSERISDRYHSTAKPLTRTLTNPYTPIIKSFSEQLPVYFPAYLSCHLHCWRHVSLKFPALADIVLANSVPSSNPELLIRAISLFLPAKLPASIHVVSKANCLFIFFSLLLLSLFFSDITTVWLDINETNIRPKCIHKCCVWLVPQPPLAQRSFQVFTASYRDAVTTVSG